MTSHAINAQVSNFRHRRESRLLSAKGWNLSGALSRAVPGAHVRPASPLDVSRDRIRSAPSSRQWLAACFAAVRRSLRIDTPSKLRPWSRAT